MRTAVAVRIVSSSIQHSGCFFVSVMELTAVSDAVAPRRSAMEMKRRAAAALSRRAVVAVGAGWVLGTAGLLLPAAMDEAEAGDLGGRHGHNHRGGDKHRGRHEHDRKRPSQKGLLRGVLISFFNSTTSDMILTDLPYAGRTIRPQESFTAKTSKQALIVFLYSKGVNYTVTGTNPDIGLPAVTIFNVNTSTREVDVALKEGQEHNSGKFLVKRLTDSRDHKVFQLTVLP
jgi:hypothetical protein